MIQALRDYEEKHENLCTLERSDDKFYGASKGGGKLEPFVQWVYLPAVKDASEEAEEAGTTALGKLLQRTVRQKVNFDDALEELRQKTRKEYDALLEKEQSTLEELSKNLAKRLAAFSHLAIPEFEENHPERRRASAKSDRPNPATQASALFPSRA